MADARGRIVDVRWLQARLRDPGAAVIEVTNTPGSGQATIPGARTVYWKDLLWHRSQREFPTAEELARRLRVLGAGASSTVVFAGDPPQFAAYALWVAAAVGVGGDLRYLDGGVPAWRDPATPVAAAETDQPALPLVPPRRTELVVGRAQVRAAIDSPTTILDLRSPEEYAGLRVSPVSEAIDHGAERHGHIPGAMSLPIGDLVDETGLLRPIDEIRSRIADLDIDEVDEIIAYCRLSHRAALGWLVFTELLGDHRVRVYDGSWTEWGSLVGAPVAVDALASGG
ncbi:sulfurtransferase [Nocardia sp. IBHARD005]|uniref:sulfurtransferase n=1 Tax=Nocardia sp. IBHARD005 TaxID=3457765 RepID=UPI004057ED89